MISAMKAVSLALVAVLAAGLSACEKRDAAQAGAGPAEKAGEQIDKATVKAGEELNKAGEKIGQGMQELGKQLQNKAEQAQEKKE